MPNDYPTCEERIHDELKLRIASIRKLLDLYYEDPEAYDDEYGNLLDYALEITTHRDWDDEQQLPHVRYLMMTGGPHDEFRMWFSQRNPGSLRGVTYVYKDWFDGASVEVTGDDLDVLRELWDTLGLGE